MTVQPEHGRPAPVVPWWTGAVRALYGAGVRRGLGRLLMTLAARREGMRTVPVRVRGGRIMYLDLADLQCIPYALTGEIPNEPGESRLIARLVRPGETVLDIGANLGWFTGLMAEAVGPTGRVLAFEPNPKTLRLLERTVGLYPNVTLVKMALLDHDEADLVLNVPADGTGASLRELRILPKVSEERCSATTLDSQLAQRKVDDVAFVKCDVEGVEMEVLRGSRQLLTGPNPPMWFAEINVEERFGKSVYEVFPFFTDLGFKGYRIDAGTGELVDDLPQPPGVRHNALFVPPRFGPRVAEYRSSVRP